MPFSLETYLEIYEDPKVWNITLTLKSDETELEDALAVPAGKLVIKTTFTSNPFILPVQSRKQNLQSDKTIKVITNALN